MRLLCAIAVLLSVIPAFGAPAFSKSLAFGKQAPASAPAGFTPNATKIGYFGGASSTAGWIQRTNALTGISDSALGLFSCWLRVTNPSVSKNLLYMKTGTRLDVEIGWDGTRHRFRMNNASGTQVLSLYTDASSQTSNVWQHIICSWDLGTAGNRKIYIDGVDKTAQLVFTTGQTIHYESTNVYVIAGAAHTIAAFDLAEVYFTVPAAYFDLATAGNREKFRSAGGLPVDLGSDGSTPTGTQPYVYLKSPFSSFGVNSGSGGNFTTNGTGGTGYISTTPPP